MARNNERQVELVRGDGYPPESAWPRRFHYWLAAAAFLALAAYGSVVPLRPIRLGLAEAVGQFEMLWHQPSGALSRTDAVVNVLLFVPVSFCLLAALTVGARRRGAAWIGVPVVVAVCAIWSVAIEFAQLWIPSRTSSLYDILAQFAGTLIGLALWMAAGQTVHAWLRAMPLSSPAGGPLAWLLRAYAVGLVIWTTLPFDLTVRPAELLRKYREGRIHLRSFSEAQGIVLWLDSLAHVAVYVPIGMLAATLFTSVRRPLHSLATSILLGEVMVCGITGLQLLVFSQQSRTSDLVTGTLGVVLGAALMRWWRGAAGEAATEPQDAKETAAQPKATKAAWYFLLAAAYAVLLVALLCRPPFELIDDPHRIQERLIGFFRPPLSSLYQGSIFNAVKEVVRKTFLFAPLGVLAALAIVQLHLPRPIRRIALGGAVLAIGGLALVVEMIQVFLPPHIADLTDVLLCSAGGLAGVVAIARLYRESD